MSERILLVEDEEAIRDAIEFSLAKAGYEVVATASGRSGLELALHQPFDAAVLDLLLPDLDGAEICARLRSAGQSSLPIVVMSARADGDASRAAFEAGATAFLAKPFAMAELRAQLRPLVAGTAE